MSLSTSILTSPLNSPALQSELGLAPWPWWAILLALVGLVFIISWMIIVQTRGGEPLPLQAHPAEAQAGHAEAHPTPAAHIPGVEAHAPAVVEAHETPPATDDLALIEGIGPKIAALLQQEGIHTFAELAAANQERLESILHAANLRMADPGSWPEQARLAAAGDWGALQQLQDELKGGRQA